MRFAFVHRVHRDGPVHRDPTFEAEDSLAAIAKVAGWLSRSELSSELGIGELMGVERLPDEEDS